MNIVRFYFLCSCIVFLAILLAFLLNSPDTPTSSADYSVIKKANDPKFRSVPANGIKTISSNSAPAKAPENNENLLSPRELIRKEIDDAEKKLDSLWREIYAIRKPILESKLANGDFFQMGDYAVIGSACCELVVTRSENPAFFKIRDDLELQRMNYQEEINMLCNVLGSADATEFRPTARQINSRRGELFQILESWGFYTHDDKNRESIEYCVSEILKIERNKKTQMPESLLRSLVEVINRWRPRLQTLEKSLNEAEEALTKASENHHDQFGIYSPYVYQLADGRLIIIRPGEVPAMDSLYEQCKLLARKLEQLALRYSKEEQKTNIQKSSKNK